MKCNPLAFWEFRDCFNYTDVNGLDIHPLHAEVGRRSCAPARAPRHSGASALAAQRACALACKVELPQEQHGGGRPMSAERRGDARAGVPVGGRRAFHRARGQGEVVRVWRRAVRQVPGAPPAAAPCLHSMSRRRLTSALREDAGSSARGLHALEVPCRSLCALDPDDTALRGGAPRAAGFHNPGWVHEDGVRHPCGALSGACCGMLGGARQSVGECLPCAGAKVSTLSERTHLSHSSRSLVLRKAGV